MGIDSIKSTVKGKEILVNEEKLSELLHMPRAGRRFLTLTKKKEGLRTVLERRDVRGFTQLKANQLSLEMRLLHNMVSRIFFPKTGRFDWVTERDIAFMHYLIEGNPINLPSLMIVQMKEAARRARACLPYGMVFTIIFELYGVDLTGEDARMLMHTDRYSDRSLHRMGYHRVENVWVKKVSGQPAARADSDDDIDIPSAAAAEAEFAVSTDESEDEEPEPHDEAGPSLGETSGQPSSPQTPPGPTPAPSTAAAASSQTSVTLEQLGQFGDALIGRMTSMIGDLRQTLHTGLQAYQEDMRSLTLRVETLERSQRTQEDYQTDLRDLRSDFGRLRGEASSFATRQSEAIDDIQHGTHQMRAELAAVLLRFTGASSAFGTSSSSQPPRQPPPQGPRPRASPSPSRPAFSTTFRSGTGFPPAPPPRAGPSARTRSSAGPPPPIRSTRVRASQSFSLDSSDSDQ